MSGHDTAKNSDQNFSKQIFVSIYGLTDWNVDKCTHTYTHARTGEHTHTHTWNEIKKRNKFWCHACKQMITNSNFTHSGTHTIFKAPALTCDSSILIYLLFCYKYKIGNYVGETCTEFRFRFNNHEKTSTTNTIFLFLHTLTNRCIALMTSEACF